jgi:DNA-binding transcriptional regulator YiaG
MLKVAPSISESAVTAMDQERGHGGPRLRSATSSRRSSQRTIMLRLLIELRDEAGLDQASLAHRLDMTQSEVSKYERGERNLDVLRLRDWLRALDVDFQTFVAVLDQELTGQDVDRSRVALPRIQAGTDKALSTL